MRPEDLRKVIDQLRHELRELALAIRALESIAAGKPRRGRPPSAEPELLRRLRPPAKPKKKRKKKPAKPGEHTEGS